MDMPTLKQYVIEQKRHKRDNYGVSGCYGFNGEHGQDLRQACQLLMTPY
jgi:hypothetical protein